MKTIKILIAFAMSVSIAGCDDKLDLAPESQRSSGNFYQTPTDFEQAILGAYSSLRGEFGDIVLYGDIRSDNTKPFISGSVTTRADFDNFSILPANGAIESRWNNSYNAISRVNAILDRIDAIEIEEQTKNRIKGEALFIRALVYFNLVRIYGNVPLVLHEIQGPEALEFPQSNPAEIYIQIVEDLDRAVEFLPVEFQGADVGRTTSTAANALLGRVYLTTGNFEEAETALRKVTALEGSVVDLLEHYADVFDITNEYNKEIIFAVRWTNDGVNGNGFNFAYTYINEPDNRATTDLYNAYEADDVRREQTINATVSLTDTLIYKYGPAPSGLGESDWPVIRYSDVLLMLSESLNEQGYVPDGEAFSLLNRTRKRAGLGELTTEEVPGQTEFRLAIAQERRVEFASEGLRWFDLVRTNRYVTVMTAKGFKVEEYHNLFPIPETEILKVNNENILKQNPGYQQ